MTVQLLKHVTNATCIVLAGMATSSSTSQAAGPMQETNHKGKDQQFDTGSINRGTAEKRHCSGPVMQELT